MRKLLAAIVLLVSLIPSVGRTQPSDAAEVTVHDDPFNPYIIFEGEAVREAHKMLSADRTLWTFAGAEDRKTHARLFYVEWLRTYTSSGWRIYREARTEEAAPVEVLPIIREISTCDVPNMPHSCIYQEVVRLVITESMMARGSVSGLTIKIFPMVPEDADHLGDYVEMPAGQFQAMLGCMAQHGEVVSQHSSARRLMPCRSTKN